MDPLKRSEAGIYVERNGQLVEVMRSGTQAPSLAAGVKTESISYARFKADGTILSAVRLAGAGVDASNDTALYADRGTGLELLLRTGEHISGLPIANWSYFDIDSTRPNVLATVSTTQNERWELTTLGWRSIAWPGIGDAAPGTLTTFAHVNAPLVNSLGHRAFHASLNDASGNWDDHDGVWADDDNGVLQLVLRDGDMVETQPGAYTSISLRTWDLVGYSDRGELLFRGDGGVYVATLEAVPEPMSLLLALIGAAIVVVIALRGHFATRDAMKAEQTSPVR